MNASYVMTQANHFLGNNIINPFNEELKWMDRPFSDVSDLAHLKVLDCLVTKQVVSMTEIIMGIPSQAKYGIFNNKAEQIYYAFEESDICQRLYCPKTRQFDLHIVDSRNKEIITVKRQFKCCAGCCWLANCENFSQEVIVESPPGTVIGSISQKGSCWRMNYVLKDSRNNPILSIIGPECICDGAYTACCENKFTLYGSDGVTEIGAIRKKFRGFIAESLTTADMFSIHMPIDLDVKIKAVLLGALFLIDFANFAQPPRRN